MHKYKTEPNRSIFVSSVRSELIRFRFSVKILKKNGLSSAGPVFYFEGLVEIDLIKISRRFFKIVSTDHLLIFIILYRICI